MSNYTNYERIVGLVPGIGSITDLTSTQLVNVFINPVESLINSKLSRYYTVPLSPAPDMIRGIADSLAVYKILIARAMLPGRLKDSPWPDKFKEDMKLLDDIAAGTTPIITDSGTTVPQNTTYAAQSNQTGYNQTFQEDDILDSFIDERKLDDLEDKREESALGLGVD